MKDVTRYTFNKGGPNSINKDFRYHGSHSEIHNVYRDLSVLKVQLKSHLLKVLPSPLKSSLKDI